MDVSERIAELEEMLAKRRNQPGFGENVKHIEAEIARLKAEVQDGD
jgi:ribosome-interacting GTPase 1